MKSELVPQAGLEPARLSEVDFESTASTIPPLGHGVEWLHNNAANAQVKQNLER